MKRRKSIWERLDLMDAPGPGKVIVELCGNERVIVENHRGVLDYGKERITLRSREGFVQIQGSRLQLRKMCGQQLVITGKIHAVKLEGDG